MSALQMVGLGILGLTLVTVFVIIFAVGFGPPAWLIGIAVAILWGWGITMLVRRLRTKQSVK